MAIIKQYHKDTDTTYVYESIRLSNSTTKIPIQPMSMSQSATGMRRKNSPVPNAA